MYMLIKLFGMHFLSVLIFVQTFIKILKSNESKSIFCCFQIYQNMTDYLNEHRTSK